ncbi:hypothetical protein [Vibrio coralliilyticus]|uniref:hypothetical protein n=1 Tax=Vibrio coralliilyticus TaxID=190893 RepID=UPI00148D907F|nr:hypothetical protein [Vibrio coralliilyticus]NOI28031.1 hypothetical protein [Vibrio coralliilyticus]NOI49508.1 hypothetical protein [Vibrio coralliilyticus]
MSIDHEQVAKRVIELSGGKDSLNEEINSNLAKINEKWDQDVDAIGRILRAHLFVEHFITECLVSFNPSLGNIKDARLTFSQKLALIEGYSEETKELAKGIKRLNKIRNQLAHNLSGTVTDQDKESLLSVLSFRALRIELAKPETPSDDNLAVLEDFAKHVGGRLSSLADPDSLAMRFERVIHELDKKT